MRLLVNAALLLLAFVVIFALAVLFLLPTERIARIATDQVRQATGRTLTIGGDISPSFFPVLGVSTGPVALSNADWADAPEMVTAASADIGVEILPLLSGQIRISRLHLVDPVISLEIGADGTPNWEFEATASEGEAAAEAPAETGEAVDAFAFLRGFALARADVENGAATFTDRTTGESVALTAIDLTFAFPDLNAVFTAEGTAAWNGIPAALDLRLDTPGDLLAGRRATLRATAQLEGATARFDGVFQPPRDGAPLGMDGTFDLEAPNPGALAGKLGLAAPPEEIAQLSDVDLNGTMTLAGNRSDVKFDGGLSFRDTPISLRAIARGAAGASSDGPMSFRVYATSGQLFALSVNGDAVIAGRSPETLDARFELTVADPAALADWVGVGAPPELSEFSNVTAILDVKTAPDGFELQFDGGGDREGTRLTLAGEATGGTDWMAGGDLAFDGRAAAQGLFTLAAKGDAALGDAPGVRARVDFDSSDLQRLAAWAGAALGAPRGTLNTLSLKGALRADRASVALTGAEIAVDNMTATGDIRAEIAEKPMITAKLATGRLDLAPFLGGDGGAGGAPAAGAGGGADEGWSREPIDFSALSAVDADIALAAPAIALPDFELGETRLNATLRDGALALDIAGTQAFGGGATGAVRVDGSRGDVALDLDVKGVRLRPLLTAFAGTDRIEGTGAFNVRAASRGESLHAIMNGLNGAGAIDLRDGALIGVNLAAMVRNATGAFRDGGTQNTDFSSVTGTFEIRDGVLTNSDLEFLGPLLRISGAGAVGLGARNLNYRMTPKAVATLEGQGGARDVSGLTFPVLVTGPWSDPQFAPDLGNAIEGLLKDPEGAKKQVESAIEGVKNLDAGALKGLLDGVIQGVPQPQSKPAMKAPVEAPAPPAAETPQEAPAETPAEAPQEAPAEVPAEEPAADPVGDLIRGLFRQ